VELIDRVCADSASAWALARPCWARMVWPIFSACCRSRLGTLDGAAGAATALLTDTAATRGATSTTPATSVRRRLITLPPNGHPDPGATLGTPVSSSIRPDGGFVPWLAESPPAGVARWTGCRAGVVRP